MDDVKHIHIDAESHLELVRQLDIRSTPTTLFLNREGIEVGRAAGTPKRDQVIEALSATYLQLATLKPLAYYFAMFAIPTSYFTKRRVLDYGRLAGSLCRCAN
jgi:hypothetical protein